MVVTDSVKNLNDVISKLKTLGLDEEANSLSKVAELVEVQHKCFGKVPAKTTATDPTYSVNASDNITSLSYWHQAHQEYLVADLGRVFSDELTKAIDSDIIGTLLSLATNTRSLTELTPLLLAPK